MSTDTLFPLPAPSEPDSVAAITARLTGEVEAFIREYDDDELGVVCLYIATSWSRTDAINPDALESAAESDMFTFLRIGFPDAATHAGRIVILARALKAALIREGIRRE